MQLPVLRKEARDGVIDGIQLFSDALDNHLRVFGHRRYRIAILTCQGDAILHDGNGVNVPIFRFVEDIGGTTTCTVPRGVPLVVDIALRGVIRHSQMP